ncbi:MAG: leucine-rich repeat domain-containing protein [Terriglobia bacterium]
MTLQLHGNRITDISALPSCGKLESLGLSGNNLTRHSRVRIHGDRWAMPLTRHENFHGARLVLDHLQSAANAPASSNGVSLRGLLSGVIPTTSGSGVMTTSLISPPLNGYVGSTSHGGSTTLP